jgi:hypothetical protein
VTKIKDSSFKKHKINGLYPKRELLALLELRKCFSLSISLVLPTIVIIVDLAKKAGNNHFLAENDIHYQPKVAARHRHLAALFCAPIANPGLRDAIFCGLAPPAIPTPALAPALI